MVACASISFLGKAAIVSRGSAFCNFANSGLQGNNVDDELRAQGITTADSIERINDYELRVWRAAEAR